MPRPISSDSSPPAPTASQPSPERLHQAREILRRAPLVDGHNDLAMRCRLHFGARLDRLDLTDTRELGFHTDLPRLAAGGVGAQFWSAFVPPTVTGAAAVQAVFEQIDLIHRLTERYPDHLAMATTAADIRRITGEGRVACLIGIEGGHAIGASLAILRRAAAAGVRYMTLTHTANTEWADAATDAPRHGGLSPFGREVVREMNRLGMLVDLSHVAPATMHHALEVSEAPVVFTHSLARGLTDHPRNIPDEVLGRLAGNGGLAMVTYVDVFVTPEIFDHYAAQEAERQRLAVRYSGQPERAAEGLEAWRRAHPRPRPGIADLADHVDYLRDRVGMEHLGIGGDYDGYDPMPVGLEDVSTYPALFAELLERGYGEEDLLAMAGRNMLRVLEEAEAVSERLRGEGPPSEAILGEPDTWDLSVEAILGNR